MASSISPTQGQTALSFEISEQGVQKLTTPPKGLDYTLAGKAISLGLYPFKYKFLQKVLHMDFHTKIGRELFEDIGAEQVRIPMSSGGVVDGVFLSHQTYKERREEAFTKWREKLSQSENHSTGEYLEVQSEADNLAAYLNLPKNSLQTPVDCKIRGVISCIGAGATYELNPQNALMFLERDMDVVMFNYRGLFQSEGRTSYRSTCEDSLMVTRWLQEKLGASYSELLIVGTSMGSGPASFAASECPGLNVLIDRGFERLSNVAHRRIEMLNMLHPFAKSLVEKYFPYPTGDFLSRCLPSAKIGIITAKDDHLMAGEAEKLLQRVVETRHPGSDSVTLRGRYVIDVTGGHASSRENYAWYADSAAQEKLTAYLRGSAGAIE